MKKLLHNVEGKEDGFRREPPIPLSMYLVVFDAVHATEVGIIREDIHGDT